MQKNGDVTLDTPIVTVEALTKELKLLLDEYERKIKVSEKNILNNNQHYKENSVMKSQMEETEMIKIKIEKSIKNITPLLIKDDQKFIINKYKEKKEQLHSNYKNIYKQINKMNDNKKLNMLMSKKDSDIDTKGLTILNEENDSLNRCLKISDTLNSMGKLNEEELQTQSKTLNKNYQRIIELINKVPFINSVLRSINFHKYKEKLILGIVVGLIVFFGLYLTF